MDNEDALLKRLIEITKENTRKSDDKAILDAEAMEPMYFEAIASYFKERGCLELAEAIETYCDKYVHVDYILHG